MDALDALRHMRRHLSPAAASAPTSLPAEWAPSAASSSRRRFLPAAELARRNESRALFGRDDCVSCGASPTCDCAAGETCVLTSRTCSQCPQIECIAGASGSGGSGVSAGAIAGPIVAVLVIASVALFWWLRRKKKRDLARLEELADRARKAESAGFHLSNPSSPAPPTSRSRGDRASAPLSARSGSSLQTVGADAEYYDEHGAVVRVYSARRGRINADPSHPDNGGLGDPFADARDGSVRSGASDGSGAVIPIHYVGPQAGAGVRDRQAAAARALDEARQNLFMPRHAPPRPARSPDLDLRLQPHGALVLPDGGGADERSPAPRVRDSVVSDVSGLSGAPSYLSTASSDLHLDAPRIVTSKQVQVGRFVGAEMVQFGVRGGNGVPGSTEVLDASLASQAGSARSDPFSDRDGLSPGASAGTRPTVRHLTPVYHDGTGSLDSSPTDLRFSMGSLAFNRDSVSTIGTASAPAPFRAPFGAAPPHAAARRHLPQQSVSSEKSGYSLLGSFPMITPGAAGSDVPAVPALPESVSHMTLAHAGPGAHAHPRLPPAAARSPRPMTAMTAASGTSSVADSVLGAFPFVAPAAGAAGALDGPDPHAPDADDDAPRRPGRLTLGMSTASSGLGDFEFSFERPPLPPPPAGPRHD